MTPTRRIRAIATAAVAGALLLTACGGSSDKDTSAPTSATEDATTAPSGSGEVDAAVLGACIDQAEASADYLVSLADTQVNDEAGKQAAASLSAAVEACGEARDAASTAGDEKVLSEIEAFMSDDLQRVAVDFSAAVGRGDTDLGSQAAQYGEELSTAVDELRTATS